MKQIFKAKGSFHALVFALLAVGLLSLSSCKRTEDLLFDRSAQERATDLIEKCKQTLSESEKGWEMDYVTNGDPAKKFRLQMVFSQDNRVTMYADYLKDPMESSYRFNLQRGAVLSFDTYGALHYLADPSLIAKPGDSKGKGYSADFEFIIVDVQPDLIKLRGYKYGTEVEMRRITSQTDYVSYSSFEQEVRRLSEKLAGEGSYFKTLCHGASTIGDVAISIPQGPFVSATFDKVKMLVSEQDSSGSLQQKEYDLSTKGDLIEVSPAIQYAGKSTTTLERKGDKLVSTVDHDLYLELNAVFPTMLQGDISGMLGSFYVLSDQMSRHFHTNIFLPIMDVYPNWVSFQWYNGGNNYDRFSPLYRPSGSNVWDRVYVTFKPIDKEKSVYQFVCEGRYRGEITGRQLSDQSSPLYKFVEVFTNFVQDENVFLYDLGNDILLIASVNHPGYWFTMEKIK